MKFFDVDILTSRKTKNQLKSLTTKPNYAILQEHKDGEILAELIPARYELREIIKDKWRTMNTTNATILGTAILSNIGEYSNTVETVITYSFNRTIYWATVEGLIRGLPTSVNDNAESSPYKLAKGWGFKIFEPVTEVSTAFNSNVPDSFENYNISIICNKFGHNLITGN